MQPLPQEPSPFAEDRKWLLLGVLATWIFMIAGNLAYYPMAGEGTTVTSIFVAVWVGVLFGQAGIGIIWLSFGPPTAWIRVVGAGMAYLTLAGAGLTGLLAREFLGFEVTPSSVQQQISALLDFPILLVSAGIPLGLLRLLLGWQIQREGTPVKSNPRQFSLGNLLLFTTLIAALLAMAQQADRLSKTDSGDFWGFLLVGSLAFMLLGAAALLPASLLMTRYSLWGGIGLACFILLMYASSVYVMIQLSGIYGGVPSRLEIAKFFGIAACSYLGFLATLCLPLLVARRCGYRLVMGGRKEAKE